MSSMIKKKMNEAIATSIKKSMKRHKTRMLENENFEDRKTENYCEKIMKFPLLLYRLNHGKKLMDFEEDQLDVFEPERKKNYGARIFKYFIILMVVVLLVYNVIKKNIEKIGSIEKVTQLQKEFLGIEFDVNNLEKNTFFTIIEEYLIEKNSVNNKIICNKKRCSDQEYQKTICDNIMMQLLI